MRITTITQTTIRREVNLKCKLKVEVIKGLCLVILVFLFILKCFVFFSGEHYSLCEISVQFLTNKKFVYKYVHDFFIEYHFMSHRKSTKIKNLAHTLNTNVQNLRFEVGLRFTYQYYVLLYGSDTKK